MHPFHRAFWFDFFVVVIVPEVDKLWYTSHFNLTGLESRQVFLPSFYSTCAKPNI